MALLRTHANKGNHNEELRKQLVNDIKAIDLEVENLSKKKTKLQEDLLGLDIAPFKIGEYAMCEVPSGRTTKVSKCLLECVNGVLYVRPVSEEGTLSQRHFMLLIPNNKTYKDYLKKVED